MVRRLGSFYLIKRLIENGEKPDKSTEMGREKAGVGEGEPEEKARREARKIPEITSVSLDP